MVEQVSHGVLVVDKSEGWTSHDVVARLRGLIGVKKAGHTGTLDPMATGVLVVCFGRATKIIPYLQEDEKEYQAEIHLGVSTDTFDREGEVVRRCAPSPVERSVLDRVCQQFVGELEQIPPMFSAAKVGGKRLYQLARSGRTVERTPRRVRVLRLHVLDYAFPRLVVRVLCSKGTYVRSLANDMGEALGCGGHLGALRRLRSGRFRIEEARTLERIAQVAETGRLSSLVIPTHEALDQYPAWSLAPDDVRRFRSGTATMARGLPAPSRVLRVFDEDGVFCGLGTVGDGSLIRPVSVFL
jgi:tRNA pseudouridine55 synthase